MDWFEVPVVEVADEPHSLRVRGPDREAGAEDLAALVVPPLVPLVRTALSAATLSCRILAWGFSNVLGYWKVRDGEAGKGVKLDPRGEPLPDGGEDELKESRNGKGGKREKKSSGGSYAEAAREAVGEMQDKGLNVI